MRRQSAQPRVDCGVLLGTHLFKQHAHAENSKAAARMHVDHFAVEFACAHAIADTEMQFRASGNRFEHIDIATTRAQFGKLCANPRSVAKGNFGICEKREARIGALSFIGIFGHGVSPVRERRSESESIVWNLSAAYPDVCALDDRKRRSEEHTSEL